MSSDSQRRRRQNSAGESEEEEEKPVINSDASDHDYESAPEEEGHDEARDDSEASEGEEDAADVENAPGEENHDADGKADKLDVDEDRRNPAYIPKRGLFYEHDDRLGTSDEEEAEGEGPVEKEPGADEEIVAGEAAGGDIPVVKKVAKSEDKTTSGSQRPRRIYKADVVEKWGHDKYMEAEQVPKSKDELITAYGYDIRNEDNAPRARRRRRYGRGPNKYTRNWEDVDAYQQKAAARGRGRGKVMGPNQRPHRSQEEEEFPPLAGGDRDDVRHGQDIRDIHEHRQQKSPQRGQQPHRGDRGGHSTRGRGRGQRPDGRGRPRDEHRKPLTSRSHPNNSNDKMINETEKELAGVKLTTNQDKREPVRAAPEPHQVDGDVRPKRYSSSRPSRGGSHQKQDTRPQVKSKESVHFGGHSFPSTMNNGPPPDAPFHPAGASTTTVATVPGTGTPPYMNPAGGMMNYGPPPPTVPYAAVPGAVPLPLVAVPTTHHPSTEALTMLAAAPHLNPAFVPTPPVTVSTQEQVMLAAAAAAATGGQGYAEVHGGVTYFHPTAHPAPVRAQMNKRPKAAIPIVDPSKVDPQQGVHHNGEGQVAAVEADQQSVATNSS